MDPGPSVSEPASSPPTFPLPLTVRFRALGSLGPPPAEQTPPHTQAPMLISRIYRAPLCTSQTVTLALWVDPGRIQFVRYYVLILVVCAPLCAPPPLPPSTPTPSLLLHTHTHLFSRHHGSSSHQSEPLLGVVNLTPLFFFSPLPRVEPLIHLPPRSHWRYIQVKLCDCSD